MDNMPVLFALVLIGLAWWNALGARKNARAAAQKACRQAQVVFIDEIALRRLRPGWDTGGPCLLRRYDFEFYLRGDRRYAGHVCLRGQRVRHVQLDPYPDPATPPP